MLTLHEIETFDQTVQLLLIVQHSLVGQVGWQLPVHFANGKQTER